MITVPDGTRIIIERSRYLSEALSKNLINHSALAKYIQPELEHMLIKNVSIGSIVMAIRRLERQLKPKHSRNIIFPQMPEMLVRSGLSLISIQRTGETEEIIKTLFINRVKGTFHSITIGTSEIVIVISNNLISQIRKNIPQKFFTSSNSNCALITIYLPKEAGDTPGVYYFFLKSLAWEGINILQCTSTSVEFTLFFEEKDVHRAYEILSSLFEKKVLEQ